MKSKWITLGLGVLTIAVLAFAGVRLGRLAMRASNSESRDTAANPSEAELFDALQVGIDGECLASKLKGNSFLVAVRASKIQADGAAGNYEQLIQVPKRALSSAGTISMVTVNLNDIKARLDTSWDNVMVSVSVCANEGGQCSSTPIFQALRLTGRYLAATNSTDKLSVRLVADKERKAGCGTL